jgi:hypothetical protein
MCSLTYMTCWLEGMPDNASILLSTNGWCESNRRTQHRFKYSGEAISRMFDVVLNHVIKMVTGYLKPKDPKIKLMVSISG